MSEQISRLPVYLRLHVPPDHALGIAKDGVVPVTDPAQYETDELTLYFGATPIHAILNGDLFERLRKDSQRWLGTVYVYVGEQSARQACILEFPRDGTHERQAEPVGWLRRGRAVLCKCFGGQYYALTLRPDWAPEQGRTPARASHQSGWLREFFPDHRSDADGFQIHAGPERLGLLQVRDALFAAIFPGDVKEPNGLIILTGATKSHKSVLARGLVDSWLRDGRRKRRHVVTVEDPIEARLAATPPAVMLGLDLDYTPRFVPHDTPGPAQALRDALRQTPAVVYVGEIREDEDWREVIHFAGTGHLVVATAHAGSLVETLGDIFAATKADTPTRRGEVARRVLAAVHLASFDYDVAAARKKVVLPALWRKRPAAVNGIVADGLSSVRPSRARFDGSAGTLGRRSFADYLTQGGNVPGAQDLQRIALKSDLEG